MTLTSPQKIVLALLVIGLLGFALFFFAPGKNMSLEEEEETTHALTWEVLSNLEYRSLFETVPFKDGVFENSEEKITAEVAKELVAYGDLNGDDKEDAVVFFWINTGGSGVFEHLVAVLNEDGKPQPLEAAFLGDRVKIQDLKIENGEVKISMLSHKSDDPLCCPTQEKATAFKIENGRLMELSQ